MWKTLDGAATKIIAHRGASGYRPEHTAEGYTLAIEQGADVIEPDLVVSSDGVLFARHDLGLARSTDVALREEYSQYAAERDGVRDWWVDDFHSMNLDDLRAIQPFPERGRQYDRQFTLQRFAQVLTLAVRASATSGRRIGVYPELKYPEYFRARRFDPVSLIAAELDAHRLLGAQSPVWLQCFDHAVLRQARERCGNPSFALIETLPAAGDAWLNEFSGWTSGIAVSKTLLWDDAGRDTGLVERAHARGLAVHAWTFREDRSPAPFASTQDELHAAFALGVDALFCDFPDAGVAARGSFAARA
jgi:glycerophosphoryl diester phosphodiesterase